MNITQRNIDDLVYSFKWSKENFKDKSVADIYRQGIYDVIELIKKKEQPFNKERLMGVAKPETPEEKAEAEERKDLRKRYERISNSDWFKKTHEGISITIPDDLVGTDMDGGVVGEKGEEGEPLIEDDRIRKAILSGMNFLKFQGRETFGGIAIDDCIAWLKKQSIKKDSPETKAIKEHMENLKKRIEDNQLGCIVQRLDKIIELLSWKPDIIPYPYTMPITYKRPLDPDPNILGGWTTTASTFGNYKKFYEPPVTFVKKK